MVIYNYHPASGELLSTGRADDNPLAPEEPIVPGYATPTAPPADVTGSSIAVYRDANGIPPQNWEAGSWTVTPDYRSVPLYRTADGSAFEFGEEYGGIGDLPAFLTDEPRPSPAHVWTVDSWVLDEALENEVLADAALARRDGLLAEADDLVAPLMDGYVLGELTLEDEARLKALSQYRKALRAITNQPGFPHTITWPVKPE